MKSKAFILLFILGLFLFLSPSLVEAACELGCVYTDIGAGWRCYWGTSNSIFGVERVGTFFPVTQYPACIDYPSDCSECALNSFPTGGFDGRTCTAHDQKFVFLGCEDCSKSGKWDYSDSQCVECLGEKENRILGNTSSVGDVCNDNFPAGDGQCESACGADDGCDEFSPGQQGNCSSSQRCDSNCQCVTVCECSTSSDCVPLAYCSGDYLKDDSCTDGCNCSGSYDCNESNRCDEGSGDDAKKYRDYYCSTIGNDHCDYNLICKENDCGAECDSDSDCPSGSTCQSDCTCSGVCDGDIDVYPEDDTEPCDYTIDIDNVDNCDGKTWRVERNGSYVSSGTVGSDTNWSKTLYDDDLDADSYKYTLEIDGDEKDYDSVTCLTGAECTGTLSVSITGNGTCDVAAEIYPSDCDNESYRIKENGTIKWSGTLSGDNTVTRSGTVGVGSDYDYDLEFSSDGVVWEWQDDDLNNVCPEAPCICGDWSNQSCGYSTCDSYYMGQTRICVPSGCDPGDGYNESRCICSESCCTDWIDDTCGPAGGCAETEMYQTRDCGTCPYLTSRCISDPICGGVVTIDSPVVITVGSPIVSEDPDHPGKYQAVLTGYLDSLGYDPGICTNCKCIIWFKWGTSGSYGNGNAPIEITVEDSYFYYTADNLDPSTTYYFEAFAKNGGSL